MIVDFSEAVSRLRARREMMDRAIEALVELEADGAVPLFAGCEPRCLAKALRAKPQRSRLPVAA